MKNLLKSLRPQMRPTKPVFKPLSVPSTWMPDADMERIHLHWTAGSNVASSLDKEHYHFLIDFSDDEANVILGLHKVWSNVPPLRSGRYAAHTYRANSRAIGIGICGMHGAKDRPLTAGKYPITIQQWNTAVALIATLAKRYGIKVSPETILTHAEVTKNLGVKQRGKWDIAWLPFLNKVLSAEAVGDKLRKEVSALV